MDRNDLGDRMKGYENVNRNFLIKRMPVIIRLDGKAFHTFTRGMARPFDAILSNTMQETMKYLCENIQGCVLGYTQSDEITLVLVDYKKLNSSSWFDNNIQKMASISASMATLAFNKYFKEITTRDYNMSKVRCKNNTGNTEKADTKYKVYLEKFDKAIFDSRVFNVPKEDVCNCLVWRQQDAIRNSIQSVGQANFSEKQLHGKSCTMIQEMLTLEKDINWAILDSYLKQGSCCIKEEYQNEAVDIKDGASTRTRWIVDLDIPTFTQDRNYVEDMINY